MAAPTSPALSPSAPSLLALEPAIKIPDGDAGYLVTLGAPNTWWIVNTAEEVVALLRTTWQVGRCETEAKSEVHARSLRKLTHRT